MARKELKELKLDTYEVEDPTRENFKALEDYIREDVMPKANWTHKQITIGGQYTAANPFNFQHGLSFIPEDIIITSVKKRSGFTTKATITVDYDNISKDFIPFISDNAAGAVIHVFIGKYSENQRR